MTQQVRKGYRNHKKGTWAAVLVVLVAAALAVVMPALGKDTSTCTYLASDPNTCVPPPTVQQGVSPSLLQFGGSNFNCDSAGTSYPPPSGQTSTPSGMRRFQISKPVPSTTPYTDPATGVSFLIDPPSPGKDSKAFFSFRVVDRAAIVYHVGVNGGTKTVWYDYYNNAPDDPAVVGQLGVYGDTDLHSTPDSKYTTGTPTFYTASITTICYKLPTISGTIWRDKNEDKQIGDTTAEPRQSGWTVTAFKKGSNVAVTTSAPSSADGQYSLNVPGGADYWLCEKRPDTKSWGQSTPTAPPSSPTQCDAETPNAINTGVIAGDLPNQNFGNLATTTVSCNTVSTSSDGGSQVQPSSKCKDSGEYVFDAWTQGNAQYVALHPATATTACASPFTGSNCQYFVQKITWTGLSSAQNPLQYDDNPANGLNYEDMLFCQKDPRSGELALPADPTSYGGAIAVLPTTARSDNDPSTSCLITSTNSVNAAGARVRTDYLFTVSDGYGKIT